MSARCGIRSLAILLFALPMLAERPLHAQNPVKRPMTVDDVMHIRNVSDPQIAPDGETVVYVISAVDFKEGVHNSDLWRVSVKGGPAIQLTNGPKRDDTPRWSPDGKRIAFLSDRSGSVQVWVIASDGGESQKWTDAPGGVKDYAWAPDGKSLALLLTDADSAARAKRKKEKNEVILIDQDYRRQHLHLFDIATKKTRQLNRGEFHVLHFDWSPESTQIAYASQPRPIFHDMHKSDLFVVNVADGKVRPLVVRPGQDTLPRWSPDGKTIAFLSHDGSDDPLSNLCLCVVPAEGGQPRNVSGQFHSIGPVARDTFCWQPGGQKIYFTADEGVQRRLFAVNASQEGIGGLPARGLLESSITFSRDGKRRVSLIETATSPKEVEGSAENEQPRRLTDTNPQLTKIALAAMKTFRWKSKDGLEIEGILILPPNYKKGARLPLLTYIHGGPAFQFARGFTVYPPGPPQASRYPVHVLAGQGYAIFCPNPRGSAAYGEKFRKANVKDWGGGDYQDIMTGVDTLIAQGIADPDRLGIMGWSYGGYMTSWILTQTHRFKAASVGAGVTNLSSMYGHTDIPLFLERYFGGPPWKEPKVYAEHSPMTFAGNIKTPTLIQHGEKDERVPLAQGQELYAALKRLGVPAEFAVYPRQAHNPQEPRMQRDVLQRNVDWFNRWLKK